MGLFGLKFWFTGTRGSAKCDRCGRTVRQVASPGLFRSWIEGMWCADCLRKERGCS